MLVVALVERMGRAKYFLTPEAGERVRVIMTPHARLSSLFSGECWEQGLVAGGL